MDTTTVNAYPNNNNNEEQFTDILIEIPELDGVNIIPGQDIHLYVRIISYRFPY